MSWPESETVPLTRPLGTVSCMRFRQRSRVDLPEPDAPMIAVTSFSGTFSDTPRTASDDPKYADSLSTASAVRADLAAASAAADVGRGAVAAAVTEACARLAASVFAGLVAATAGELSTSSEAGDEADREDEDDEDEGAGPGLRMPIVIGALSICIDLQGKGGNRLIEGGREELVAEGRE